MARRLIDVDVWAWVIDRTELERLMDKEAKDQLRDQMRYIPERVDRNTRQLITGEEAEKSMPPVTVENIYATLEQFMVDADTIFRRGMANAFSKLDRRFRSFKIGHRVILDRTFNEHGHWSYHSNKRDTLMDIERTFAILDGKIVTHNYASTIGAIDHTRRGVWNPRQDTIETDYFKVRIFKNGNAHLWFQRDDLVEKVNKLLAEYYGEAIGDGQTKEENPFDNIKTAPAKYFGFYPTPEPAAHSLMSDVSLYRSKDKPRLRILEPSAGTGNLARLCFPTRAQQREKVCGADDYRWDPIVDCVEIQPHLANELKADRRYHRVLCQDFMSLSPKTTGLYDIVLMNPPFDRERDIDHVIHALEFLEPEGMLAAIMSAGTEFRETRKSIAFRDLIEKMGGTFRDLPPGSFSSVGTHINTLTLHVRKNGTPQHRYNVRRRYYY